MNPCITGRNIGEKPSAVFVRFPPMAYTGPHEPQFRQVAIISEGMCRPRPVFKKPIRMYVQNIHAKRAPYPEALRALMNVELAKECRRLLGAWPLISPGPTPLWHLPDLAHKLGVAAVYVKDESKRSVLNSFKALGAPIAVVRLVTRMYPGLEPSGVLAGRHARTIQDLVVISATDGNHGRGLAAAAQSAGIRCVVVLHEHVSTEREEAIAAFGAEIVRIKGNYDESVAEAARLATVNGWQVVSDTSYEGYEVIPRDVMQGYGTIVDELIEQSAHPDLGVSSAFTHIFLQGGVGGMAAGIVSYFHEITGPSRPVFVIAEPHQADCLLQSAVQGRAAAATGSVDSLMAGLACGRTSALAWRFLEEAIDHFVTVSDEDAVDAMRLLARGSKRDIPIVSGESGAAGLAGLRSIASDEALRARVGLGQGSNVLLINTEGATAPSIYEDCTGRSSERVLDEQSRWLARTSPLHAAAARAAGRV